MHNNIIIYKQYQQYYYCLFLLFVCDSIFFKMHCRAEVKIQLSVKPCIIIPANCSLTEPPD